MTCSTFLTSLLALLGTALLASAHMEMEYPPPLMSKYNPHAVALSEVDYSMTSPLTDSNYPCKGYNTKYSGTSMMTSVASFEPGSTHNFTITGGANHGGGSCQASLSYDGGKTFTVIQSIEANCPGQGTTSFDFTVPADAPSGNALFAWTWFNKIGNREMYMNCASVSIDGGSGSKRDANAPPVPSLVERGSSAFKSRPNILVANVGDPACTTVAGKDTTFPDPGPDVVNNGGDPSPPVGNCGGSSDSASAGSASASTTPSAPSTASSASSLPVTAGTTTAALSLSSSSLPGGVFITKSTSSSLPGSVFITESTSSSFSTVSRAPASSTTAAAPAAGSSSSISSNMTGATATNSAAAASATGAYTPGTACSSEGAWNCIGGGTTFQRCASGQWSATMTLSTGMKCRVGEADTLTYATEGRRKRRVGRAGPGRG